MQPPIGLAIAGLCAVDARLIRTTDRTVSARSPRHASRSPAATAGSAIIVRFPARRSNPAAEARANGGGSRAEHGGVMIFSGVPVANDRSGQPRAPAPSRAPAG